MLERPDRTRAIIISTVIMMAIAILTTLGWSYFLGPDDGENTPTTTVTVAPSPDNSTPPPTEICDSALFHRQGHGFVDGFLFCDAGWARGGASQSDHVEIFRWVDGTWVQIPRAGVSPVTEYPCYDTTMMRHEGAPEALLRTVLDCAG